MTTSVGLIGFGLAGRYLHAPIIRSAGMEIKAVVSSRRDEIHADFPDAQQYSDIAPVLERDDIEFIVLTTPNELHYPQALAALEHGKHVVTDKPFTIDSGQARALIDLARSSGLKMTVYHNRRWDADFLTIQNLIKQGDIGDIYSASLRWDRWRPEPGNRWRDQEVAGAGLLYDLGPHLIDQAILLIGKPDWLQADVYIQRPGGLVDDGFEILMGKDRIRLSIGVNYMTVDGLPRYIINGSKATFRKSWLDPQEDQLRGLMSPEHADFGIEPPERFGVLHYPDGVKKSVPSSRGRWLSFYEGMRDAIEHDKPEPVDPVSALYVMQIMEASFESHKQQRRISLENINNDNP